MEKKPIVWISENLMIQLILEGDKWKLKETGGILMGYKATESEFVITNLVGPGPKATHAMHYFIPDNAFHKKEIARLYRISGRSETYLGDWHTHPNSYPYLSLQDLSTFERIAKYKPARLPTPLMLIASPPTYEMKIWVYLPARNSNVADYKESDICFFHRRNAD